MENNEKPQQRKRRYKEEPNGNLELKNTVTEIKILTDGLSSRMGKTKERINELEQNKLPNLNRGKCKINRASETYETITKGLTCISL